MCKACYEKGGSPTIDTPKVRNLARLIADFDCFVATPFYSVLQNWNVEDWVVERCSDEAEWDEQWKASDDFRELVRCLREATEAERHSAMYLSEYGEFPVGCSVQP